MDSGAAAPEPGGVLAKPHILRRSDPTPALREFGPPLKGRDGPHPLTPISLK